MKRKTIGVIGAGAIGLCRMFSSNSTLLTVAEINQEDIKKRELKQTLAEMISSSSLDDSKCKKGHSYRSKGVTDSHTEKWVCIKCRREL